jgi:hypothetical protein
MTEARTKDLLERRFQVIGRHSPLFLPPAPLHHQATAWDLPQGFTRHAWDADGLAGEQPFRGAFWALAH